jgi:hypothetical protein
METFLRPELAAQMARQLIKPSALDVGLRSGLFLSGMRRTGKTTFLLNDLIPALEALGAIVVYVDLWKDISASPEKLLHEEILKTLLDLQTPRSALIKRLRKLRNVDIGLPGLKFSFDIEHLGRSEGVTLVDAFTEIVDLAKTHSVLIVDEVQQAITTEAGRNLLLSLKAARDAINARPGTPGYFLFIGTGSHRALVSELTARNSQAFSGATSIPYPVLGRDYTEHLLNRLRREGYGPLPDVAVAAEAFDILGNRPEELIRALRLLCLDMPDGNPDELLPVIARTLCATAADIELRKITELGNLAEAIFARIASADGDARGVFSGDAISAYSTALGRAVRIEEIQPVVHELLAANVIMRRGHGAYTVTDPFVRACWLERGSFPSG